MRLEEEEGGELRFVLALVVAVDVSSAAKKGFNLLEQSWRPFSTQQLELRYLREARSTAFLHRFFRLESNDRHPQGEKKGWELLTSIFLGGKFFSLPLPVIDGGDEIEFARGKAVCLPLRRARPQSRLREEGLSGRGRPESSGIWRRILFFRISPPLRSSRAVMAGAAGSSTYRCGRPGSRVSTAGAAGCPSKNPPSVAGVVVVGPPREKVAAAPAGGGRTRPRGKEECLSGTVKRLLFNLSRDEKVTIGASRVGC